MSNKGKFVGCDPEFGYKAKVKSGSEFTSFKYPAFPSGGRIGYDHSNRVVELRPDPGKPFFVIAQMGISLVMVEKAFKKLNPSIDKFIMIAGGVGSPPTGGHIHFDKCPQKDEIRQVLNEWEKHKYLLCEPGRKTRVEQSGYGKSNEFREDHKKSVEWRTPSSWLSDPRWAFCILSIVYSTYFNVELFGSTLVNYKTHLKYIKSVLSPKEWRMFLPYYNMWNSHRVRGKMLPSEVNMETWENFMTKMPKTYCVKANAIIQKYIADNKIEI